MVTTTSHLATDDGCAYLVSTTVPAGQRCERPAAGRWQEQDDEQFCAAHLGDDVAAADLSICPRCFCHTNYDAAWPECGSCGHTLPVVISD